MTVMKTRGAKANKNGKTRRPKVSRSVEVDTAPTNVTVEPDELEPTVDPVEPDLEPTVEPVEPEPMDEKTARAYRFRDALATVCETLEGGTYRTVKDIVPGGHPSDDVDEFLNRAQEALTLFANKWRGGRP